VNHVSLFSGIGGIDIAAEWAGFRTIAQVERDPYCLKILERHWPGVHRCREIRDFPDKDYGAVTLVSGGFPCQPFSAAGKRRGKEDDRYLWPEMLRVIREIKPRWVLAENVPGILNLESGLLFKHMLDELEASGYEIGPPLLIPASGVGANHRGERIFVIAHTDVNGFGSRPCGNMEYNDIQSSQLCFGKREISQDVANTRKQESRRLSSGGRETLAPIGCSSQDVPDTGRSGRIQPEESGRETGKRTRNSGQDVANTESMRRSAIKRDESDRVLQPNVSESSGAGLEKRNGGRSWRTRPAAFVKDWWTVEPNVGRVAHGVPHRVDRLRALGNAVVPQQVYPILQAIAEAERESI